MKPVSSLCDSSSVARRVASQPIPLLPWKSSPPTTYAANMSDMPVADLVRTFKIPIEEITKHTEFDLGQVERVANRTYPAPPIVVVDYDLTWPQRYEEHRARIASALGDQLLGIDHVGSTSVPGCPAKPIIDIDLVVRDILDETSYIPLLERAGYIFLFRERHWRQHRYMVSDSPDVFPVQIHIWGKGDQVEIVRHRIMADWLKTHPDDLELYAETKRKAAAESAERGEKMMEYNERKKGVIRAILGRAFKSFGYT